MGGSTRRATPLATTVQGRPTPPTSSHGCRTRSPTAWATLAKNLGSGATDTLISRLRDQLDKRGTLDLLRQGLELIGLRAPLKLAQFKPALDINADLLARYKANRLRVVRQVRYSLANENCFDLVLFLNGIPVATAELKSGLHAARRGRHRPVPGRPPPRAPRAA